MASTKTDQGNDSARNRFLAGCNGHASIEVTTTQIRLPYRTSLEAILTPARITEKRVKVMIKGRVVEFDRDTKRMRGVTVLDRSRFTLVWFESAAYIERGNNE